MLPRKKFVSYRQFFNWLNSGTAAVCVYPYQVNTASDYLRQIGTPHIPVASVATGFPSGQYSLKSRLEEIRFAIDSGATEIDIVLNRTLALGGRWRGLTGYLLCLYIFT